MSVPQAVDLRCEHLTNPLGTGVARPRLSWRTATDLEGWTQSAYQVEVRDVDAGEVLWDSGRVASAESVLVPYDGPPLRSRQRCDWRVRVWGSDGVSSEWSETTSFETGLLDAGDWSARFVTPDWDEDTSVSQPCPYLRRGFELAGHVTKARLYVTALGVYEIEINGELVGDHVLSPGWTSYDRRLRYQTYDVTGLLRPGANAIGAVLGDGWARGYLGFLAKRNRYTDRLALLARLEITLADGSTQRVTTDESWRAATGPMLASDIYNGETHDARRDLPGWSRPAHDDSAWPGVRMLERDLGTLVAPAGPPVRRIEELRPVSIAASPSGKTIADFGQNLVGRVRLRVSGPAGTTITLRHAEVLDDGELFTRALRSAQATDRYTLKGDGVEEYEPRFTFHGFRYAEVDGWPGELSAGDLAAVVCHSDMARTGWFECSDADVNRLHENIVWSLRDNFLDIPTDCPQRSERLGWTGDIQVFAPTACLLYDVAGFLSSWLADLAADQLPDGGVPHVVPDILAQDFPRASAAAGWADAAVVVPWVLYRHHGDRGLLETQYPSMRAWVEHMGRRAGDDLIWDDGHQFGDWLDPAAPPDKPGNARTDPSLVATAYFAHSTELHGRVAAALGKDEDAARYADIARRVKQAFRERYAPGGRLTSDAQTAYVLALDFDLLLDGHRAAAAARLVELIAAEGGHLGTGFLGTPRLCDVLTDAGYVDVAYALLLQRTCPSWLYPVTKGATTIWERWDAIQPDGSINPGEMLSFNHYAFGAIGAWLYGTVAGVQADPDVGWRRPRIRPRPGGGLTHAKARVVTPYGPVESTWRSEGSRFSLAIEVPPNTTAEVWLPGRDGAPLDVGSGRHEWSYELHRS
ncbi:MAG: family 78 glycoside hydrolase catalytic domain [Dehalococcoidia bacterium]